MSKPIYSCLWFDGQAKAVADYYCSIFKEAKIIAENPVVVIIELNHTKFMLLNGGPQFKHSEAVSFVVECDTQEEIDHYWYSLTADGGAESMCGWLKDKWGVSWQIVPSILGQLMSNPENGQRVMQALLKMNKLDIAALKNA
ncbi:MAG: hypothetical protein RLZZ28_562 [Bacteroidota bacterium]|jgi:predicted 3-demethylubiquinone-9 3-methyltransferase (glyoxalase superfamily)